MKSRSFRLRALAAIILLPTLLILCTSTVRARLYPPVQPISYSLVAGDTIRYSIIDPVNSMTREETWTIPQGNERYIESAQHNQGILTWIDKYRNTGDAYYSFTVQYRIYDPGRGSWKAGSWGPFTGYETSLEQHQVVDGVVAWTSKRRLGLDPSDVPEQKVLYVTYEPEFGTWTSGNRSWVTATGGPEVLRVGNGIVAWPMKNPESGQASNEDSITIEAIIFDHELKQWIGFGWTFTKVEPFCMVGFDWIAIYQDTAQVQVRMSCLAYTDNWFLSYDPSNHKWLMFPDNSTPYRRAYFKAWPDWGIVPFRTWFWDLSTGLEPPSTSYLWNLTAADSSTERSPGFQYTTAGFFDVLQNITYINPPPYWFQSQVSALAPGPTGSININNNAAYTNSYNVTLSLSYEPTAAEMRFKQVPGLSVWGSWQAVAPSKAWTLSGIYVGDIPDGTHTVYVQYRTAWGVVGDEYQDSIELDVTPPAGTLTLNGGTLRTNNPVVQAVWSAADLYPGMQMSYSSYDEEDGFGIWSQWQSYAPTTRNFTFSGRGGRKTVLVRFKDAGGNIIQMEAFVNMDWRAFLPLIRK